MAAPRQSEPGQMGFYELRLKPGAIATLVRIKFSSGKGPQGEKNEGSCYRCNRPGGW
jgi:hypothetical protein